MLRPSGRLAGKVYGLDMAEEMLALAIRNRDEPPPPRTSASISSVMSSP